MFIIGLSVNDVTKNLSHIGRVFLASSIFCLNRICMVNSTTKAYYDFKISEDVLFLRSENSKFKLMHLSTSDQSLRNSDFQTAINLMLRIININSICATTNQDSEIIKAIPQLSNHKMEENYPDLLDFFKQFSIVPLCRCFTTAYTIGNDIYRIRKDDSSGINMAKGSKEFQTSFIHKMQNLSGSFGDDLQQHEIVTTVINYDVMPDTTETMDYVTAAIILPQLMELGRSLLSENNSPVPTEDHATTIDKQVTDENL